MAAWKQFEREIARLLGPGAHRYWANSGEQIDVEGPKTVAQCKLVQRLSLESLSQLAEMAERHGIQKRKAGVVAVKVRRGRGRSSPTLIVMTADMWRSMHGPGDTMIRTLELRDDEVESRPI